ncbi:MAG: metallophosphoesterase [Clostridia bacterium]|nr:metallophosphoesterase [Clostridia bacterium]
MAKEKIKGGKRGFITAVSIIILLAVLIAGLNFMSLKNLLKTGSTYEKIEYENQLIPEKDENGYWYFTTDSDFKVMHLTDIHIGGGFLSKGVDRQALNAVALMVSREKPDLVIVTGDIAFPVPYTAGTFNNYSGIKAFGNLMENLGVYWDVTLGNHDSEAYSYFDREAVAAIYGSGEFEHCLFQPGPEDVDGYGNHIIKVKNSEGIITQAMILIDSQAYIEDNIIESIKGTYDNIHENQVEWYEAEIKRLNDENSKTIKAIQGDVNGGLFKDFGTVKTQAFFHIPLVEMDDAWNEFKENDYQNTEDFEYIEGLIGETGRQVCCGFGEDALFEKMLELKSTKAIHNGHDHVNSTTFRYKGITFSYGYSVDYFAYSDIDKLGSQRGCTMITLKPDTTFYIDKYNYYSDRYNLEGFNREEVTMQYEDVTYQVIPE